MIPLPEGIVIPYFQEWENFVKNLADFTISSPDLQVVGGGGKPALVGFVLITRADTGPTTFFSPHLSFSSVYRGNVEKKSLRPAACLAW